MSPAIWMCLAAFCVAPLAGKTVEYPFKQLEQGGFSKQRDPRVFVIRSPGDYQAYNKVCGRETAAPQINWSKDQVLAIHIGSAPSTGYGVFVKRIVKTGPKTVDVVVVETTPPAGTMQAMHITYPFVIVTTPRFSEKPTLRSTKSSQKI